MKLELNSWYRFVDKKDSFPFGVEIMKFVGRSGSGWPCFDNEYRSKKAMINAVDETFELAK